MMKLRFDTNRRLARKPEDQKAILPLTKELNEQELATVTGGWGGDHGRRHGSYYHHYRHHHRGYDDY
jgi:bacteriocin-like protein